MANAKQLPSGSWRVLLYAGTDADGKRRYESITAPTKTEANLLAAKRRDEIEKGIRAERIPQEMTVGEAIDRFIDDRDSVLSPKTIREYRNMRKNHLSGIMDIRICKLRHDSIQREFNREAKKYSPKTLSNVSMLLKSAIHNVIPDYRIELSLPPVTRNEMHIPTNDQLMQLITEAEGLTVELPLLLGATCGLRRGEISAITENDIDWTTGEIRINKSMTIDSDGNWSVKSTKTPAGIRTVTVPDWVLDKLKEHRGEPMPSPPSISDGFIRLTNRLHIDIRFHDLRHYYASLLLALGTPMKYAQSRMGHATPNMINKVYGHIMADKDREITAQVNGFFEDLQHDMQHMKNTPDENERKTEENR